MTHTTSDYDYIFKLILIGDSGVGKSCLLTRFADETYHDATLSTIGVDFKFRNVTLAEKTVKLQVWDTAGQEKFRTIVASYYRGAHGILLAYDTTNAASFENLGYWLQEVKRFGSSTCPVVLVGTKTDLKSKRVVPEEAVRAFAEQYCGGANTLVETSAKTNEGVEQAFQLLAQQVFKQRVNVDVMEPPRQVPRSLLQPTPDDHTAQCGC